MVSCCGLLLHGSNRYLPIFYRGVLQCPSGHRSLLIPSFVFSFLCKNKETLHIHTDAKGVSTRYHLCYVVKTTYLCRLIPKPLSGNGDNSFLLTSDCFWRYTTCKFCHLSATDRFCATVQKLPSTQHVLVTSLSRWMSFSFRCLCVLLFLITFLYLFSS